MIITVTTLSLLLGFALWSAGLGAKAKGTVAAPAVMPTTMQPRMNLMTATPCSGVSFAPYADYEMGARTWSVAVGDFNGDDKLDLVTANYFFDFISVRLGNGMGGFGPKTTKNVGRWPHSVAVGDFNRDNKLDLATANNLSNDVSVLLGDGTGGFAPKTDFGAGGEPISVAVGDFNLDGKPDLATANSGSGNVSVLLGDGMGGFGPKTDFGVGSEPRSVAVGDFNLDGKPDLVTANSGSGNVSVLLGDGTGGFGPKTNFGVGNGPGSVAVGDFNLDGKPDLVTANSDFSTFPPPPGKVSVLLGDGMGGFGPKTNFAVVSVPTSVAVGDFNLDGNADLAVTNGSIFPVEVLLGDGTGSFGPGKTFSSGAGPQSVAVGDFNLDGRPDLATANQLFGYASVLINNCTSNTAPVAVCRNVTVSAGASCTASVTAAQINNGSSDPDGDSISLSLDNYGPFGLDSHTVELIVNDSNGASSSCTATVTVVDQTAPTITLNGANPMTIECPYGFVDPGATATDNCAASVAVTTSGSVNTAVPGSYTITYSASDGRGNTATRTRTVNVRDTIAPTLTLKPDIQLWPPDHSYRTLTMSQMVQSVSDGCHSALSLNDVKIEKVTSDEPDNVKGNSDGETINDILIAADCKSVQLRSERDEKKNGRVYVITLRVKDAAGNATRKDFKVSVPLNQSGAAAAQDAAAQTKTGSCP
jgi:hypothetical protein